MDGRMASLYTNDRKYGISMILFIYLIYIIAFMQQGHIQLIKSDSK